MKKPLCRTQLSALVFLGQVQNYMVRTSLSLIILAMVQNPAKKKGVEGGADSRCYQVADIGNTTDSVGGGEEEGELDWDNVQVGFVFSSFSWGYMTTQIIGGRLAELYGFKKIYGVGTFLPGLLMFFHPVAARTDVRLFIFLRALMGVACGGTWPAMHVLTARWVPPAARSSFISQTYMGGMIGIVLSFPLCGLIITHFGWDTCFYLMGSTSLLWTVGWAFLAHDNPKLHPSITEEELAEIEEIPVESKPPPLPWRAVVTSRPIWGIIFTDAGNTFGLFTLLKFGPAYLKYQLGLDMKSNGFLSAAPMLARYFGGIFLCRGADWLVRSKRLGLKSSRRIFNTISQMAPALAMVTMAYSGCNPTTVAILLVLGMWFNGALSAGHMASHVDLAPNFSGTLFGISNTVSGGGMGSIAPLVITGILGNEKTLESWQTVFWLTGAIYCTGAALYFILVQAEPQKWNFVEENAAETETGKEKAKDQGD